MPSLRTLAFVAAVAVLIYIAWTLVDFGGDRVRNQVERQNNEAARNADDDRLSFDDCPDGMWRFDAGECERAP